jgi:hypothetical protein
VAGYLTDLGKELILRGTIKPWATVFKAMLLNGSSNISQSTEYVSEVSIYEVSGDGYEGGYRGAGRKALQNRAFGRDGGAHVAYMDCDDLTWEALGVGDVGVVAVITEGSADANSVVVAYDIFDTVHTAGGDWVYEIDPSGLIVLS